MKADVHDFFMTGDHEGLATSASRYEEAAEAPCIKDALEFLLYWQVVDYNPEEESAKRVTRGAGMGPNYSGDIADCYFAETMESWISSEPVKK